LPLGGPVSPLIALTWLKGVLDNTHTCPGAFWAEFILPFVHFLEYAALEINQSGRNTKANIALIKKTNFATVDLLK
jgi:hypothetical protein